MSEWIIKKGNTAVQDIPIRDVDGELVENLGDADEIKFQIKLLETGAALVEKTEGDGIEVLAAPLLGYLRLTLSATDTGQVPKDYKMGLQITWGTEVREVVLKVDGIETEKLKIVQDIVNT